MTDALPKGATVTVYCPRCDKPFSGFRKRAAMRAMEKHVQKAHPELYPELKEQ